MESPAHETSTSAFTSASSRPGGVAQVHNLLDRLELRLQLSQWLNLALAGALVLSAGAHGWHALHPPQPEYFATTADGRLIPLVPISEPYVAQETLLAWVTEAVTQAYTLDYVHYRKQLAAMRPNFSDEGFKHHLQALEAAGTLEAIIKRRLVSQVVPTAPPVVVNQVEQVNRPFGVFPLPLDDPRLAQAGDEQVRAEIHLAHLAPVGAFVALQEFIERLSNPQRRLRRPFFGHNLSLGASRYASHYHSAL